ncbi:MAG: pyrroline-5-carboxylate reductase [Rhodocyclaceae bacterium]
MKITFVGGGNMANALAGGLLKRGFAAAQLRAIEPVSASREKMERALGVRCFASAVPEALACDVLVLAVKPQQMQEALAPIAGRLAHQLVISIAAGLRLADLSRWLGGHRRLVRTMPNTPALVGAGITGLYADPSVDAAGRAQAESVLAAVGGTLWIADEAMMDAVTAVSGSGPAYVFYFLEALAKAAVELGFAQRDARRLAIETFAGGVALARASDEPLAALRERVTSKGGTTEAALRVFDAEGVGRAIRAAVLAACERGRELGASLGRD